MLRMIYSARSLFCAFLCVLGTAACGDDVGPASNVGADCRVNSDCTSGVCLPVGTTKVCTDRCRSTMDCPTGWTCDVFAQVSGTICQCEAEPEMPGNGVDEDCDGVIDESGGDPVCGDGVCSATETMESCPADCTGTDSGVPPSGTITVELTQNGTPAGSVPVVLHGLDGSVIQRATSGADGRAVIALESEVAMVSAIFPPNATGAHRIYTYAGVKPGDVLSFRGPGDAAPPVTPEGSTELTGPGAFSGANEYDATVGCQGGIYLDGADTRTFEVTSGCVTDGKFHALMTAVDGARQPLAYSFVIDQTTVPGGVASATFPAWQTDFGNNDFQLNNPPPGAGRANVSARALRDGRRYGFITPTDEVTFVDGAAQSSSWPMPTGFVQGVESSVELFFGPADNIQSTMWYVRRSATAMPVALDLTADLFPKVHMPGGTAGPRPVVTWVADGPLSNATFGRNTVSWSVGDDGHQWHVMIPPETASGFQFPELPSEFSERFPPASGVGVGVVFGRCDASPDYDNVRRQNCPRIGFATPNSSTYDLRYVIVNGAI